MACKDRKEILIICNNGGHLLQAVQLKKVFGQKRLLWVTKDDMDSREMLPEGFISGFFPVQKNLLNALMNMGLALKILIRNPSIKIIISTGSGIAPPFFLIGRILGKKTIFIESFSRVYKPSLTGRLCRPFASRFYVQWNEIKQFYPEAFYRGRIF